MRRRQHGTVVGPPARRLLERSGWRTTLEYRETHVRTRAGQLLRVDEEWVAEAERFGEQRAVAQAVAATPNDAWEQLLDRVELGEVDYFRRVRLAESRP